MPRTANGRTLPLTDPLHFSVSDISLSVTADGLVRAVKPTNNAFVVVTLNDTSKQVTLTDTVFITVTSEVAPPRLATFSIQPAMGDSTKISIDSLKQLTVSATDSNHNDIADQLPVLFRTRNRNVVDVDRTSGLVQGVVPGRGSIIEAEISYYGIVKRDSVSMVIGYPLLQIVSGGPKSTIDNAFAFSPTLITLGVGGTVVFEGAASPDPTSPPGTLLLLPGPVFDIRFDTPSAARPSSLMLSPENFPIPHDSGDIDRLQLPGGSLLDVLLACFSGTASCAAARSFSTPGSYPFHDSYSGANGVVIVR
jgi:hypothetical protein